MNPNRVFLLAGLGLTVILISGWLIQQWFHHQTQQAVLHQFVQIIQTNSQPLDGDGRSFQAQADFNAIHFDLTEHQTLPNSQLIPLVTIPATTSQTSFSLVLALKTRRQEFTSFGQDTLITNPTLFAEHIQKVFTQRGVCQLIIEIDHHDSIQTSSNSWKEVLKHEAGLHVSEKFGRVVLPTNFNIVSCQN